MPATKRVVVTPGFGASRIENEEIGQTYCGHGFGERKGLSLRNDIVASGGLQGLHAFNKTWSQFWRERALEFDGNRSGRRVLQGEIDFCSGVGAVVADKGGALGEGGHDLLDAIASTLTRGLDLASFHTGRY